MLIHDKPLLGGQPSLNGNLSVPLWWPFDGGLTV